MTDDSEQDRHDLPADIDEALRESGAKLAGRLPFLGHVTWLGTRCAAHRLLFLQDLEWRVLPPLMLEQFKLYFDRKASGLPVAYVSWACLSASAEGDYVAQQRIAPGAWNSGERLWLVDLMVPFGGARRILGDIQAVHASRDVHLLYPFGNATPRPITLRELIEKGRAEPNAAAPTQH